MKTKNGRNLSKRGNEELSSCYIIYDFESWYDKKLRNEATASRTYEDNHVPISVSMGDTLEREPTYICNANPEELTRRFMEELERRGKSEIHVRRY